MLSQLSYFPTQRQLRRTTAIGKTPYFVKRLCPQGRYSHAWWRQAPASAKRPPAQNFRTASCEPKPKMDQKRTAGKTMAVLVSAATNTTLVRGAQAEPAAPQKKFFEGRGGTGEGALL